MPKYKCKVRLPDGTHHTVELEAATENDFTRKVLKQFSSPDDKQPYGGPIVSDVQELDTP